MSSASLHDIVAGHLTCYLESRVNSQTFHDKVISATYGPRQNKMLCMLCFPYSF